MFGTGTGIGILWVIGSSMVMTTTRFARPFKLKLSDSTLVPVRVHAERGLRNGNVDVGTTVRRARQRRGSRLDMEGESAPGCDPPDVLEIRAGLAHRCRRLDSSIGRDANQRDDAKHGILTQDQIEPGDVRHRGEGELDLDHVHQHAQVFAGELEGGPAGLVARGDLMARDDTVASTCGKPLKVTMTTTRVIIGSKRPAGSNANCNGEVLPTVNVS